MEKRDKRPDATVDPTGQNRTSAARWHAEQAADGGRDKRGRNAPRRIADDTAAREAELAEFNRLADACEVCEDRPAQQHRSNLGSLCVQCERAEVAKLDDRARQGMGINDRFLMEPDDDTCPHGFEISGRFGALCGICNPQD